MTSVVHNDTYPAIDSSKADLSGKVVFIKYLIVDSYVSHLC